MPGSLIAIAAFPPNLAPAGGGRLLIYPVHRPEFWKEAGEPGVLIQSHGLCLAQVPDRQP